MTAQRIATIRLIRGAGSICVVRWKWPAFQLRLMTAFDPVWSSGALFKLQIDASSLAR